MKINKQLNLVIPVDQEDGSTIYVHATPIGTPVFERFFLPVSKAYAAIWQEGLNVVAGPRIAFLMLRKISQDMGVWDGPEGVEAGLIAEMRRLANVVLPGAAGWTTQPLQTALDRGLLEASDVEEVEGALTFFTVASCMQKKTQLEAVLGGLSRLWGAQCSSLSCTEYAASLRTSTETDSSGETVTTSSVPA